MLQTRIDIRKNHRIVFIIDSVNSKTEFEDYNIWLTAEALSHAGHIVTIATNRIPEFIEKLEELTHHSDIRILDKPKLRHERLLNSDGQLSFLNDPKIKAVPSIQSILSALKPNQVGCDMAPKLPNLGEQKNKVPGVYTSTYSARIFLEANTLTRTGDSFPDSHIKIVSNGLERSGIQHQKAQFETSFNEKYLISCKIFCDSRQSSFRLGVKGDICGNIWTKNLTDNSIHYANTPGEWTEFSGILTIPKGIKQKTQLWILLWEKQNIIWYLSDISLRRIHDFNIETRLRFFLGGNLGITPNVKEGRSGSNKCNEINSLILCRPFKPSIYSDFLPCSFYFVDPNNFDTQCFFHSTKQFQEFYVEQTIFNTLGQIEYSHHSQIKPIPDLSEQVVHSPPRVLFLCSNDTHAHFLHKIAKKFKQALFVIPNLDCKQEGAREYLSNLGITFTEIDYNDSRNKKIESFKPNIAVCGADWTSEFMALHRIIKRLDVPCIAIQEGPQDWEQKIKGIDPNKYRNAEILFAQGPVTVNLIKAKYFAISGNPKTDHIIEHPLPAEPTVFINCNFTYGQYEDHRRKWINDVTEACNNLNIKYFISKHPRDTSKLNDPNLILSSTSTIAEQISQCSIVVSRFSNITYEALTFGRTSVYYNPHGEPMQTFNQDETKGILKAYDSGELKSILAKHKLDMSFKSESAFQSMLYHCGPPDGKSINRISQMINTLAGSRPHINVLKSVGEKHFDYFENDHIIFSVIVCTHNRSNYLRRALRSVLDNPQSTVSYEIIIVDNASTDNTEKVVEDFKKNHTCVRYIFEPRLGLSIARNTGWQNAKGQFAVFIDDDGEVEPDWLQAFYLAFKNHPDAAAVGGQIIPKYSDGKPWWIQGQSNRFYGAYHLSGSISVCEWVPGGNAAWRIDVLKSIGGFDDRFGRVGSSPVLGSEESVLIKELKSRGGKMIYSPNALMWHNIDQEKTKFLWLLRRYYGQGVTEFRFFRAMKINEYSISQLIKESFQTILSGIRNLFGAILNLFALKRKSAVLKILEMSKKFGYAFEFINFSMNRYKINKNVHKKNDVEIIVAYSPYGFHNEMREELVQISGAEKNPKLLIARNKSATSMSFGELIANSSKKQEISIDITNNESQASSNNVLNDEYVLEAIPFKKMSNKIDQFFQTII